MAQAPTQLQSPLSPEDIAANSQIMGVEQPATTVSPTVDPFVRQGQAFLNEAGFNAGPVDGLMGPKTSGGIQSFQTAQGLPTTGQFDPATRQAIANFQFDPVPTPDLDTTVGIDQLEGAVPSPIQMQTPTRQGIVDQEVARAEAFVNNLQPTLDAFREQQTGISQQIQQLLGGPGATERQQGIEDQLGVKGIEKELSSISGQIQQEIAGLRAGQQALADQGAGRSTEGLLRRKEQLEQQATNRILGLQATATVLQGNLDSARNYASRMAQIQSDQQRSALEAQMFNLEQVQRQAERIGDEVTARQAQAREFQLTQEMAMLEEQDTQRQQAIELALSAIPRGANAQEVASFISDNPTVDQAIARFGEAMQTPTEAEALDLEAQRQQLGTGELEQQLLRERINTERAQQYTIGTDTATQLLPPDDIVAMTKLEPVKQLENRARFLDLLDQYRNKINEVGLQVRGEDRGQLESILGELQIAYKNAAELGALVGADFELLDRVIPKATENNFVDKAIRQARGRGVSQMVGSLDETISRNQVEIQNNLRRIGAIDPRYLYTDYLDIVLEPIAGINDTNGDPLGLSGDQGAITNPNNPLNIEL